MQKIIKKIVQNQQKIDGNRGLDWPWGLLGEAWEPFGLPGPSGTEKRSQMAKKWPCLGSHFTKNDFKMEPKIRKNRFWCLFFQLKERSIFWSCFFFLFEPSGRPWTLKIKPKRCKGVQKQRSHLFTKNLNFTKKCTKHDFFSGPSKPPETSRN